MRFGNSTCDFCGVTYNPIDRHSCKERLEFHFPARAQQRSPVASVNKMREEFAEFLAALTSEPVDNQVEELWDLIQTMEQHMRDYQALGVDVFGIRQRVQDKCQGRGLYGENSITLSPSEAQTVFDLIDNPPEPNEALRAAMRRRKEMIT